jgi:hypothetical protein
MISEVLFSGLAEEMVARETEDERHTRHGPFEMPPPRENLVQIQISLGRFWLVVPLNKRSKDPIPPCRDIHIAQTTLAGLADRFPAGGRAPRIDSSL